MEKNKNIKKIIQNIFSNGFHKDDFELLTKIVLINIVIFLGIVFIFFLGILSLYHNQITHSIINFTATLALVILYLYIRLTKKYKIPTIIGSSLIGLFFLFFLIYFKYDNYTYIWNFIYPLLVIYLLGKKKGAILCAVHIFISSSIFVLGEITDIIPSYPLSLIVRYNICYTCIFIYAIVMTTIHEKIKYKLKESNNQLKNLDKLKNDFIANITHDFRTPLMVIQNNADLALKFEKNLSNTDKKRYLSIYNSSLKLNTTITHLLELSRMDSGEIKFVLKKTDIIKKIQEIFRFYKAILAHSKIELNLILPPVKSIYLYIDVDKTDQIINNLISNAIKFVNPENGKIKITLEDFKNYIIISIIDNGIGIPGDKLKTVFNRFEQLRSKNDKHLYGTGIGLAFAKQLVELLKGEIWVESSGLNKGSTFKIKFFKSKDMFIKNNNFSFEASEIQNNNSKIRSFIQMQLDEKNQTSDLKVIINQENQNDEYDIKKALILIIDDDPEIREIVFNYLKFTGYSNFLIAPGAKKALEAIYEYSPDIIISDINMPEMKGDEFHDNIVENPKYKLLPIIFISAVTDKKLILNRKEKGSVAYLTKPVDENELTLTVDINIKKYFEYKKTIRNATIDDLTLILNKKAIQARLVEFLSSRKIIDFSLLFLDIDHFKNINDTYGHKTGDFVLEEFGEILKNNIRKSDVAGRFGGEEFLVLLPDTDLENAIIAAEKIRKSTEDAKINTDEHTITFKISIGVTSLSTLNEKYLKKINVSNLSELYDVKSSKTINWTEVENKKIELTNLMIHLADKALYNAKSTICNRCHFSTLNSLEFKNGQCPKCKSGDIEPGRNRVKFYPEIN